MMYTTMSLLVLVAGVATAKSCVNMTVPVTISARTGVFDKIDTPQTNLDATAFQISATRQGQNGTEAALSGYKTTSGTYQISAKYCKASTSNSSSSSLQILTHGIGFDKSYWDIPYNGFNYSYINVANGQGYDTLSYDRLGIGNSSHGDPKNEIQAPLEIAALQALTLMMRKGNFPGVKNGGYKKIVHVGHSFGSAQTYALTAMDPTISDGIVLTGFSMNSTFMPLFTAGNNFQQANLNQPLRFGSKQNATALNYLLETYALTDYLVPFDLTATQPLDYPNGYLVASNVNANEYPFYLPPYFDEGILYFGEQSKQPVTIGELLTSSSAPMMNPFKGPVLVFTGSNDLPFCGGDCFATGGIGASIPAAVKMNFPSASRFEAYIQPNTAHGINFHYNATAGYQYIQSWLKSNSL